jgi:hypothetical protein
MPDPKGFPSLHASLESLESARYEEFADLPASQVANENAFSEMKAYILNLYEGVEARHGFMDDSGGIFDCIPYEQQPALRGSSEAVPTAPDIPPLPEASDLGSESAATRDQQEERYDALAGSLLNPDRTDQYGNVMHCSEGTIPMRRVTLEQMTRFETVQDFLRKGPGYAGRPPRETTLAALATVPTHRWAQGYQVVNNLGGHSFLNLWRPTIGPGQVFSLSQHWYIGGSGANEQTVECGWHVYPAFYNDTQPHLFTYWTADHYVATGCYNLTCGAFVQTPSPVFAPGMALSPISAIGGPQYSMELAYRLSGGRWWLYFNGTQASNAIGSYPVSLFGGGALATQANEIDFGGETAGTTSFPRMGSGLFANQGWQRAAYQRTIGYWPPSSGGVLTNANLILWQPTLWCYTAEVHLSASPWYETLWFGGSGGSC